MTLSQLIRSTVLISTLISPLSSRRCLSAQVAPENRFAVFVGGVNRDLHGYRAAVPWGYALGASFARESNPVAVVWTANVTRFASKSIVVPPQSAAADRIPAGTAPRETVDDWRQLEFNQGQGELTTVSVAVGPQFNLGGSKHLPYFGARVGMTYLGILGQHYFRPALEGSLGYSMHVDRRLRIVTDLQGSLMPLDFKGHSATAPRWLLRPAVGISFAK